MALPLRTVHHVDEVAMGVRCKYQRHPADASGPWVRLAPDGFDGQSGLPDSTGEVTVGILR